MHYLQKKSITMFEWCNLITLRYFWITSIPDMCNLMSHYVVINIYNLNEGWEKL